MKNILLKAILALLASAALPAAGAAAELNSLSAGDVKALAPGVPAPSPAAELLSYTGRPPVVITVAGLSFGELGWGPLELKHFVRLINILFPRKADVEAALSGPFKEFNDKYFLLDQSGAEQDLREVSSRDRLPDNYLEQKISGLGGGITVVPFPWSRDPGDSAKVVPQLERKIIQVYDSYKSTGRPICILAHSWGSVLAHSALHRVDKDRPDVRIDKFITAGSPLVPANFVVALFDKLEIGKEDLEKRVSKPSVVRVWRNFWSSRDPYSNSLDAADSNCQVDAGVEKVEPRLLDLMLHDKPLRGQARKDLFKIRDIKAWHSSYFFDYSAYLASIGKEISVAVFQPDVAPQVESAAKGRAGR